jgi:hypothetical protein
MPNEPSNEERLTEPLNFVSTPTMKRRVIAVAKQRGVKHAVVVRWAVEYWLANGAPVPDNDQHPEESQA